LSTVGHVVKRLALATAGYVVAVVAGLLAVVAIYALLSSLPGAPAYFDAMAVSPVVAIAVPVVGLFVLLLTFVLTFVQVLITALLSEFFALRSLWMHALFGALAAATGFMMFAPTLIDGTDPSDMADIGIVAASGLVAGLVYWLIAGRDAGFSRRPEG
jgi:hypothetical protein